MSTTLPFTLFCLTVKSMFSIKFTVFPKLQFLGSLFLIFGCRIIPTLTFRTCQRYNITHNFPLLYRTSSQTPTELPDSTVTHYYSTISATTPDPTVRPPSRTAKRNCFSIAIGVISSAEIETLSPGITISTPSGNLNDPVTSVVLK